MIIRHGKYSQNIRGVAGITRVGMSAERDRNITSRLLRGGIVNRTYGTHKNLPGIYLPTFTHNIWPHSLWSPVIEGLCSLLEFVSSAVSESLSYIFLLWVGRVSDGTRSFSSPAYLFRVYRGVAEWRDQGPTDRQTRQTNSRTERFGVLPKKNTSHRLIWEIRCPRRRHERF